MNAKALLNYVVARLKEPSTYAGLAALAGFVGLKITPDTYQAVLQLLVAVAGLVAVLMPDVNGKS